MPAPEAKPQTPPTAETPDTGSCIGQLRITKNGPVYIAHMAAYSPTEKGSADLSGIGKSVSSESSEYCDPPIQLMTPLGPDEIRFPVRAIAY
jgi:hypothetical protein